MSYQLRILICFLILLTGFNHGWADTLLIGSKGTEVDLPGKWLRQQYVEGLGEDQFFSDEGARLLFVETVQPYFSKESLSANLKRIQASLGHRSKIEIVNQEDMQFRRFPHRICVYQVYDVKESGIAIRFCYLMVAQEHLSYLAMVFAGGPQRISKVSDITEEVMENLRFPGPDSQWAKDIEPTPHDFDVEGALVELTYSEPLWDIEDSEEAFLELESVANLTSLYLFSCKSRQRETLVKELGEMFEGDGFSHVESARFQLSGLDCEENRWKRKEGDHQIFSLLIPGQGEHFIEMRFESFDPEVLARKGWEEWKRSIRVKVPSKLQPFPATKDVAPAITIPVAPPFVEDWLGSASWLGTAPNINFRGCVVRGDSFLVYGRGGVERISADRSTELLYPTDSTLYAGTVTTTDEYEYLIWFGEDHYYVDDNQEWQIANPRGFIRAPLRKELLLVRRAEAVAVPGIRGFRSRLANERVRVDESGEVRSRVSLAGSQVTWLVASRNLDRVCAAIRRRGFDGGSGRSDRLELLSLDASGKEEDLGRWAVSHIGPTESGWIVSGQPAGAREGIYLLEPGREPELLVTGPYFWGVTADDDSAVLMGKPYRPAEGSHRGSALYRVPLAVLREKGALTMPFDSQALNQIGADVLGKTPLHEVFASQDSIEAWVGLIQERAQARFGRTLPIDAVGLDRAFRDVWTLSSYSIDTAGRAVLSALVCQAFFEKGAEWLPGGNLEFGLPPRAYQFSSNCYSYAVSPAEVLYSTLYDPEGYWTPVSTILSEAEGRKILLSFDPDAIASRLSSDPETEIFQLLEKPDMEGARNHLREYAENHYLRFEVYLHLGQRGLSNALVEVSRDFLGEEPLFFDLRAHLSGRYQTITAEGMSALIDDLKAAISRFPQEASLYELLAESYLARSQEDDTRRAMICFEKVIKLGESSDYADYARKRLEELK